MSPLEEIARIDTIDSEDKGTKSTLPDLPPELEYTIFLCAFLSHKGDRMNLFCVAKRVHDWLIPFIYKVLCYDFRAGHSPGLASIQRYGHHVRRILIIQPLKFSESDLFKYCPNIWDLGFWVGVELNEGVFGLKDLKRLVLRDFGFFLKPKEDDQTAAGGPVSTAPAQRDSSAVQPDVQRKLWFENITHILVTNINIETSRTLLKFPNLTHLMVISSTTLETLQHILRLLPKLEVLVWLLSSFQNAESTTVLDFNSENAPRTDDKRVVTVNGSFMHHWVRAARVDSLELEDMWEVAEKEIRRRG